jgi:phage shock protein A
MYENLVQEIKTAENNILFFTGKSQNANKLVDDMRKKIDTLKEQLNDLEKKINQMDNAE